jgi:flagellar biosynthetic protein FliQ
MEINSILDISREALFLTLKISLPVLLTALFVGLLVSLVQALTQIQDQTIAFVPKLIAIFVTLFLIMPYIGTLMTTFNETISNQIVNLR